MITLSGRLYIRYHQFKRFQADDVLNILAMLLLVVYIALQEWSNREDPNNLALALRSQLAVNMTLWTTLYLVKFSFLALIWSIFKISRPFRKAWWAVTIYSSMTFLIIFLSTLWQCGEPSTYDDPQACNLYFILQIQMRIIFIHFVLHISSDCFILILPLVEIRKLHMPLGRKISAAAVFALVIIDIVTGLARNISTVLAALGIPTDTSGGTQELCDVIEPALAVLICSLPAYKALVFKFRSHRTDKLNFQRHAANIGGKRWLPHKLRLLTASIPSPFLDISILGPAPTTEQRSEESLIKAPEVSHVVAGEEEKQH